MKGLISFITSYKDTSSYSGSALSPSIFNALASAIWAQSEIMGGNALVGSFQKRRISENFASFDSTSQRVIQMGAREVVMPVDTIVSDFGTFEIMLSHEMHSVLPSYLVTYVPEFHKIAYLTNSSPQAIEYAPTGLSRKGEVWLQGTLEVHNEKTDGVIGNLTTS